MTSTHTFNKHTATSIAIAAACVALHSPGVSRAQEGTITFEDVLGETPSEGMTISNQYQESHGVTFRFADGGYPTIAKAGSPRVAFNGYLGQDDMPAPDQNVGTYFLTDDGILGGPHPDLYIDYSTPVAEASGMIIDVDVNVGAGTEEGWRIDALDETNGVTESVAITPESPNSGDGLATFFSFAHSVSNIHSLRIVYTGTKLTNVGLAFDNFSPSSALNPFDIRVYIWTAVELGWNTVSGLTYQVQWCDDLEQTNWVDLYAPTEGDGGTNYCFDSVRGRTHRFYRVVQTP